jgi:hypothetical protein
MGIRLFAEEMREEFLRRQDLDPQLKQALKGLTFRLIMLSLDAPGKQDRQIAINLQGGRFISIVYDIQAAPSELRTMPFDSKRFDARGTAPHEVFFDLCTGKKDLITAFPLVKIEGNIGKLMGQIEGFVALINFISKMDIVPG